MSQYFTSPNYWGYNLQQMFEGDVKQIPKIKRHLPTPVSFWMKYIYIPQTKKVDLKLET